MTQSIFEWKEDQQAALTQEKDLVLTASAGTGKTTILVEKFARRLLASIREENSSSALNRMLGITFTDLAAAELKSKIREKLIKESESADDNSTDKRLLVKTIRDLDAAYIGTIHGFCRRILQENFISAAMNPGIVILDEQESKKLKQKAVTNALFNAVETDVAFADYVKDVGIKSSRALIISLSNSLRGDGKDMFDPEELIRQSRERWVETALTLVPRAAALFEEMAEVISRFNNGDLGGNPNDNSRKLEEIFTSAYKDFQQFIDDPECLLTSKWPDSLTEKKSIPFGQHKELKTNLKPLSVKLRGILAIENPAVFNLHQLADIESNVPVLRSILHAVLDYNKRFASLKDRIDKVDFDDLLLKARDLLLDDVSVRNHYQQQFKYIFVDEFQDVNHVQRDIVRLLRGSYRSDEEPSRSMFIVGDGKQSIYRFRSADVTQFNAFIESIKAMGGTQLQLESNFRSHPNLVRAFNVIFGRLFEANSNNEYQMEYQGIVTGKDDPETDQPFIEAIELTNNEKRHEGMIIARKINDLISGRGHPQTGKKYNPGDIAVLLRATTNLNDYELEFLRAAIPYTVLKGKGFYIQREIWDVAAYLKLIWFPGDDYALATVLRSPLCLFSDDSLMMLSQNGYLGGDRLFNSDVSTLLRDDENERFRILRDILIKHRHECDLKSSAEIINDLMAATDYDAFLLSQDGGDQRAANIRKLIELAREFESTGVESGLEFTLDLESRLFTDKDESQANIAQEDADAVKIMTVHRSKGLQFPVVIIPHLYYSSARSFNSVAYDEEYGVGAKTFNQDTGKANPGGSFAFVSSARKIQDEAESLRLLYVAATRAEEHLVFPVRKTKFSTKSWQGMLSNIGALNPENAREFGISAVEDSILKEVEKPRSYAELFQISPPSLIAEQQTDEHTQRLLQASSRPRMKPRNFSCSIWGLIHYLFDDDKNHEAQFELLNQFQEVYEDDSPTALQIDKRDIGTAVHSILESLDFSSLPSKEFIEQELLAQNIDPTNAGEAATAINAWLKTRELLRIIDDPAAETRKELEFTLNLKHETCEFVLFGTIDLFVEFSSGERWLIDYKYAEAKDSEQYKLQLQLYAMALAAAGKAPDRAILAYLKDRKNIDVPVSTKDLEAAKDFIVKRIEAKTLQSAPG